MLPTEKGYVQYEWKMHTETYLLKQSETVAKKFPKHENFISKYEQLIKLVLAIPENGLPKS